MNNWDSCSWRVDPKQIGDANYQKKMPLLMAEMSTLNNLKKQIYASGVNNLCFDRVQGVGPASILIAAVTNALPAYHTICDSPSGAYRQTCNSLSIALQNYQSYISGTKGDVTLLPQLGNTIRSMNGYGLPNDVCMRLFYYEITRAEYAFFERTVFNEIKTLGL